MRTLGLLKKPKGFIILFLMLALPVTLYMTRQTLDTRQRASGPTQSTQITGQGRIQGNVYRDNNKNTLRDPNEPGYSDAQIIVFKGDTQIAIVPVDGNGSFRIYHLPTEELLTVGIATSADNYVTTINPVKIKLYPESLGSVNFGVTTK